MRHFLDLSVCRRRRRRRDPGRCARPQARARRLAEGPARSPTPRSPGTRLAMVFEKSSTRTRVSFDMAMRQLGGTALVLDSGTTQLGRGESVADTARVLSGYLRRDHGADRRSRQARRDGAYATVPVINGLTDASHPCQIVADLLTVVEEGKALPGLKWAWLGDGNNVLHSIVEAAGLFKFSVSAGVPGGLRPRTALDRRRQRRAGRAPTRASTSSAIRRGRSPGPTSSSPTPGSRWARRMPRPSSPR